MMQQQLLGSQLGNASEAIGLPYTPYKFISPMMGNYARLLGAGNNTQNSLSRYLQETPSGQAFVKNNPNVLQYLNTGAQDQGSVINQGIIGSAAMPGMPNVNLGQIGNTLQGVGMDQKTIDSLMPLMGQGQQTQMANNQMMGNQVASPTPAVTRPANYGTTGGPAPLPSNFALTPDQINKARVNPAINDQAQAVADKATNNQYTSQQLQQMTYDNSAQNMLQQVAPQLDQIKQYAGLKGTGQLVSDRLKAAFGEADPRYQSYNNFTRVQAPLVVNEIRRAFGGQATDAERSVMDQLVKPNYWDSNPSLAPAQMQALADSLHANTRAISQSKSQNVAQAQQSLNQPNIFSGSQPQVSKAIGGKNYVKVNGQWYEQ
jgi:hypothetical protein